MDRKLLMSLMNRMEEMTGVLQSLRRQMARMEAKSMHPNAVDVIEKEPCAFLDFDSTLAAEGFPIHDSDGIEKFELKLKDLAFRKKMAIQIFDSIKTNWVCFNRTTQRF